MYQTKRRGINEANERVLGKERKTEEKNISIGNTDIRLLQNKLLEIFKEIDRICKKHNIRYFAIGGTCLGAVRHKGFIPWDDDMDLAMPRTDYERFKEIASKEFQTKYKLILEGTLPHYPCSFMKIHDQTTTFIEERTSDFEDRYTGVNVDVMPLDGIPKSYLARLFYFGRIKANIIFSYRKMYGSSRKQRHYHLWKVMEFLYLNHVSDTYFMDKIIKLHKKYPFDNCNQLAYTWSSRGRKIIFQRADFEDIIELPFENVKMPCPVGYDDFLTAVYGDYMKLPPKEEQVPLHKLDIFDLHKPAAYYLEKRRGK